MVDIIASFISHAISFCDISNYIEKEDTPQKSHEACGLKRITLRNAGENLACLVRGDDALFPQPTGQTATRYLRIRQLMKEPATTQMVPTQKIGVRRTPKMITLAITERSGAAYDPMLMSEKLPWFMPYPQNA